MELEDLPEDVLEELTDPKFASRQHYSRATYALGCRGPLCKKGERDRGRFRNQQDAKKNGRTYRPGIKNRVYDREELLSKIIIWHLAEVDARKPKPREWHSLGTEATAC